MIHRKVRGNRLGQLYNNLGEKQDASNEYTVRYKYSDQMADVSG